ncbi:hypothetical protein MKW98_021875 [Papaver atlanticum]|uniref:Uncharacterized protein n=1 Tax=Papaver atlanticum TaxID=357466 RepID=A0AAD4SEW0_9MAGN|nr:hypothetical protein MKW98_021875 [Papaver atlanticum]
MNSFRLAVSLTDEVVLLWLNPLCNLATKFAQTEVQHLKDLDDFGKKLEIRKGQKVKERYLGCKETSTESCCRVLTRSVWLLLLIS